MATTSVSGAESPPAEELIFFESHVRPLLVKHCLECHAGDDPKGGVDLSSRSGWMDSGVIKVGDSHSSLLLEVVRSKDDDTRMPPPPKASLSPRELETLSQWIDRGAVDPRESVAGESNGSDIGPKKRNRIFELTDEDRRYWAFQTIQTPEFSPAEDRLSPSEKIDRLLARDAGEEDHPGVMASPRQRLRRLFLDLWGLPPTFEQVEAFQADPSEEHWQQFIEELLASRHYGERWGRYWLDWVRFGETNGYERDGLKPNVWRYRDYVIDAFESDKPYDRFLLEQLAGDEWAHEQGWALETHPVEWRAAIIATGFYRLHVWDDEPDDTETAEYDDADDIMVTIGSAFLGLTIGCARCHDHKFDPISQRDYYSMLSFLRGVEPYGLNKKGGGKRGTGRIQRPLVPPAEAEAWEQAQQQKIAELQKRRNQITLTAERGRLDKQLKQLRDMLPPFDAALAVAEVGAIPKETFILHRGDPKSPRDPVSARIPQVLEAVAPAAVGSFATEMSSGRRLQFARWLIDPKHPLTARVIVNRVWQRHFGTGLVPTLDDFGATGLPPSHPALLDYLASELIESGWSLKHLHRIILSSQAYRQVSGDTRPSVPSLRRLDAEAIRDSILKVTGRLGSKRSGPSIYPRLTQEVKDSANPVSLAEWQESPLEEQACRSVYLIVKRSLRLPFLEVLDFPGSTAPTGIRSVTTTAPQALLLLNEPWMEEQARGLYERVLQQAGQKPLDRIRRLWQLVYQRLPSADEEAEAARFLQAVSPAITGKDNALTEVDQQRWTSLCRGLLNSSEFLYWE